MSLHATLCAYSEWLDAEMGVIKPASETPGAPESHDALAQLYIDTYAP